MIEVITILSAFLHGFFIWVDVHKWTLLGIAWITYNREILWKTLYLEPIRGGNGVVKPDELAKWVMTALLVYVVLQITTPEALIYIAGMLITGVAAIAGIQLHNSKQKLKDENTEKTSEH